MGGAGDATLAMRYAGMSGGMAGPSHFLPNAGSWPMYPQMTMSPHTAITTSHSGAIDPSLLASQLGHMQLGGMATSVSVEFNSSNS
jgi:hypothetical protein